MNAVKKDDFQFIIGTVPLFFSALAQGAVAGVGGLAVFIEEIASLGVKIAPSHTSVLMK